eukprot:CAMPEP_0185725000 /NCGR_PEP_ID=MMETSP1171-20130828/1339_1 /TAXON_ID=374046 /ORGANISM="Helicotheca tamensis, Strain CCMP826" /LENGTH=391 /DNA_ID=CAMNT_0028392989 /DNA_START=67 /DNA_END=1239 /DNA_ORIENTATION=+
MHPEVDQTELENIEKMYDSSSSPAQFVKKSPKTEEMDAKKPGVQFTVQEENNDSPLLSDQTTSDKQTGKTLKLVPSEEYFCIHFSGCGFMLPYHLGVVSALRDYNIRFSKATATSGGCMAALAMIGGGDPDLVVRQCFDLRCEKGTTIGSIRSFMAVYREYFRCFRGHEKGQCHMSLADLRNRLFVRLGRWTRKGWEIYQVSDFQTEKELEDAFLSAAYIPFLTSVVPPRFRGETAYDAGFADMFMDSFCFSSANQSLWPPNNVTGDCSDRTKVLVTPSARQIIDSHDLLVVNGKFHGYKDFWAHPEVMRYGFIEGYQEMASLIDTSGVKVSRSLSFSLTLSSKRPSQFHAAKIAHRTSDCNACNNEANSHRRKSSIVREKDRNLRTGEAL